MCCHSSSHSENYLVRWGSKGFPKEIEMLNNLKVVFTVGVHCFLVTVFHTHKGMILETMPVTWSEGSLTWVQICVLGISGEIQQTGYVWWGVVCPLEAIRKMDLPLSLSPPSFFLTHMNIKNTCRMLCKQA